jgi:hypothetical protein
MKPVLLRCPCGRAPKLRRITEHLMHYRCACGTEAGCGKTIKDARKRWNALMRR